MEISTSGTRQSKNPDGTTYKQEENIQEPGTEIERSVYKEAKKQLKNGICKRKMEK